MILALLLALQSDVGVVSGVKVTTDKVADVSSLEAWKASFIKPGMSDEEYQKKYKQQRYPTAAEVHQVLERNPEGAATRGLAPSGLRSRTCRTSSAVG